MIEVLVVVEGVLSDVVVCDFVFYIEFFVVGDEIWFIDVLIEILLVLFVVMCV